MTLEKSKLARFVNTCLMSWLIHVISNSRRLVSVKLGYFHVWNSSFIVHTFVDISTKSSDKESCLFKETQTYPRRRFEKIGRELKTERKY